MKINYTVVVWDATVSFVNEVIFESNSHSRHTENLFWKKTSAGFL
jgi:hypothetical protein